MKRGWLVYAALLAVALAAGLGAGQDVEDSPTPSVHNPGARGLKLLHTWLSRTGHDVRVLDGPLDTLPADLTTLVIAAPTGHEVSSSERAAIEQFVRAGGTLVFLSPRRSNAQETLDTWLKANGGKTPPRDDAVADDLLGFSDRVTVPGGPLAGVTTLRLLTDQSVVVDQPGALPLTAEKMLWLWPLGRGRVFIGAGADLAEAARLETPGNAAFWAALASRGPLAFDEYHQVPKPKPALSANLVATGLQLAFCALAFLLAFGRRLGPPRPTLARTHRSSLEYVRSMAALTASAGVEPELAEEMVKRLQRVLDVPDPEMPVSAQNVRTKADLLALSRRCAEAEARARGLSPGA